ncbi:MAG TPA: S8 family serine peptidase [Solirubrobacter sp.]|nr:S8 family serine peptidase [Solirubrobacter sp.]
MRRSLLAVTAAAMLGAPTAARAAEGDIIVQRVPGADAADVRKDAKVKLVETLPLAHTELVAAPAGRRTRALADLQASDDVVYAELDRPVSAARAPDEPISTSLWALRNVGQWVYDQSGAAGADIDAVDAWARSEGEGVMVAVVDSGVDVDHPDLRGQIATNAVELGGLPGVDDDRNGKIDDVAGWDFVDDDPNPADPLGHGTHVAGTIAAAGATDGGVVGVAPSAKLLPLRVLDASGSGYMSTVAAAFAYAADRGVRIVNASITGEDSQTLRTVIKAHPNTLFVVAAGNDHADVGTRANGFPCRLPDPNVICVGATDNRDQPASFSNVSATAVDLFAPGVSIYSTYTWPLPYWYLSGTSMAAPHVSGAAALALAARPGASTEMLRQALLSSVDVKPNLRGKSASGGRLNANAAVTAILRAAEPAPTPTPSPPPPPPPPAPVPPAAPEAPQAQVPAPVAPPAARLTRLSVKRTLRVTFRLTAIAPVRFSVTAKGATRPLASWTYRGHAGANALSFAKRLPTGRRLRRGTYTLRVATGGGAAAVRPFRVR